LKEPQLIKGYVKPYKEVIFKPEEEEEKKDQPV